MSSRPAITRTCRYCGAQWTNTGKAHKTQYCSTACGDAARRNSNKSNWGVVPVGKHFWRSHDGAECIVFADARGLPYAEAVREMEVLGQ